MHAGKKGRRKEKNNPKKENTNKKNHKRNTTQYKPKAIRWLKPSQHTDLTRIKSYKKCNASNKSV